MDKWQKEELQVILPLYEEYMEYWANDKHPLPWDIWLKYKKRRDIKMRLPNPEKLIRDALETIGRYCTEHNCDYCELVVNDDICITDIAPNRWKYYLKGVLPKEEDE